VKHSFSSETQVPSSHFKGVYSGQVIGVPQLLKDGIHVPSPEQNLYPV
jgi:hypothetical protein